MYWIILTILSTITAMICYAAMVRAIQREQRTKDEFVQVRADRDSFKTMYGPNNMAVLPPMTGMVSDGVLVDVSGKGSSSAHFCVAHYNLNDKRWVFSDTSNILDPEEYTYAMTNGRWYRLPLKKYEVQRNSR